MGAVLPRGGREPFVEDLAGSRGQQVADPLPLGAVQRLLSLHLGQGVAAVPLRGALAQLDQLGAARFGPCAGAGVVDGALAAGELVDGELSRL